MGDIDVSDQFHNFFMHEDLRCLAGIDLTMLFPEELLGRDNAKFLWEQWSRCGMGFKPSPYCLIQGMVFVDEFIRGDPSDEENDFRWDTVLLNLSGSESYDPSKPWVSKRRFSGGKIAADFITYVDDVRSCGGSWQEARDVARRIASLMNWLGIQDAAHKR